MQSDFLAIVVLPIKLSSHDCGVSLQIINFDISQIAGDKIYRGIHRSFDVSNNVFGLPGISFSLNEADPFMDITCVIPFLFRPMLHVFSWHIWSTLFVHRTLFREYILVFFLLPIY